jgi:lysylphosphatidylglycerol synthetase-like protein (DUF2156 family)
MAPAASTARRFAMAAVNDSTPRVSSGWLAALLALAGALDLGSALTPALGPRIHLLQELLGDGPIRLSRTATVLVGLCALMLAQSIARRNRRAATLAVGALLASGLLNILKGLDFEEASFCFFVAWLFWRARHQFVVGALPISWLAALRGTSWFAALCLLYAEVGAILLGPQVRVLMTLGTVPRPAPFPVAAFFGLWTDSPLVTYVGREGQWFHHSLRVLAVAGVLYAVARLLRPLIRAAPATHDERQLARALLAHHGSDALCYFHLRPDRSYLFTPNRDGFVSYVVRGDVALLGGDPVCSQPALRSLIRHVLDVFRANGLKVCVVGASAGAMHAYRAEGMRALKIGEEAVIDLPAFDAEKLAKRVRRAGRSVAARGVRIRVSTMADMDPLLIAQCHAVSKQWLQTRGGVEQGFSMTSGPLPAASDCVHHVVLAVLPGACGAPERLLGFLTLAPVPALRGLSLDHMRRVVDAPNGLMESLVMHAAAHFRDAGYTIMSLNFAALCDRECPEGEGAALRAARFTLFEGARHLPLVSLYRFNKKFEPRWACRYWLYGSTTSLPSAAYATVRAEVAAPSLFPGRLGAAFRAR